ncbi:hypothetical protein TruAng_009684 [Truncatella angustata]|nr:hypothetical protein TruAng_009684 [Truncatella angustata]
MASDDALPVLKVLIIGPSGAGKSAHFKTKKLSVRGQAYRLNVFDTAGQERFRTLSTSYYRGAHGVIIVYDISSRSSFASMDKWIEEARNNANPDAVLYIVGSKLDKVTSGGRATSAEEGQAFADAEGAGFCEVSSKTRENVRRPFIEVIDRIVQKPELLKPPNANNGTLNIGNMASDYSSACPC